MSGKFPDANYRDVSLVAKELGFYFYRQAKGDHEIWRRDRDSRQTTIPNHGRKSLKRKTLKSILNDLNVTGKTFLEIRSRV